MKYRKSRSQITTETIRRKSKPEQLSVDWHHVVASTLSEKTLYNKVEGTDVDEKIHFEFANFERPRCRFINGSIYEGQWNTVGLSGFGMYVFPNEVEFEGNLHDGMFHGEGTLTYPMGQKVDGNWTKGKAFLHTFRFADGLEYDIPWKYCQMPDRRFFTSIQEGLRPAGRSLATNQHPPRKIPEGCYDTGDGFYNPAIKCVVSAIHPAKILRVPTATEEQWIMEHCRKAWDEPAGYRPDLFEHWVTGRSTDSIFTNDRDDSNSSAQSFNDEYDKKVNMIMEPSKDSILYSETSLTQASTLL